MRTQKKDQKKKYKKYHFNKEENMKFRTMSLGAKIALVFGILIALFALYLLWINVANMQVNQSYYKLK
jgi:hypothetical protein